MKFNIFKIEYHWYEEEHEETFLGKSVEQKEFEKDLIKAKESAVVMRIPSKSYWFSQDEKYLTEIKQIISGEKPAILIKNIQLEMTEEAIKKIVSSGIERNRADFKFRLDIKDFLPKME